jgi:hypothetical protein
MATKIALPKLDFTKVFCDFRGITASLGTYMLPTLTSGTVLPLKFLVHLQVRHIQAQDNAEPVPSPQTSFLVSQGLAGKPSGMLNSKAFTDVERRASHVEASSSKPADSLNQRGLIQSGFGSKGTSAFCCFHLG